MEDYTITKKEFGLRLAKIRENRGISARQMSLEIGQNKNYINSIEAGHNYPTMHHLFDICNYLHVSPASLLYTDEASACQERSECLKLLSSLPEHSYSHVLEIIRDLSEHTEPSGHY